MKELPSGWTSVPFDDLGRVVCPNNIPISRCSDHGIIRVIDQGEEKTACYSDETELAYTGPFPVVAFGDHTRRVKYITEPFIAGAQGLKLIECSPICEPRFLFYWLQIVEIPDRGYSRHFQFVRKLQMPLPPITEQRRIVAEIEKQLSRCDFATASLAGASSRAVQYRRSYLKSMYGTERRFQVFGGVKESDAALAEVVRARHSLQRGSRTLKPVPPAIDDALSLPAGWIIASVDEVCSQVTDGEHIQPPYQEQGLPMLSATHVRNDSVNFDNAGLISPQAFAVARARCAPTMGDILVVSVGATTGRVGRVRTSEPFVLVRSVLLLKPLINSDFLMRWLQSPNAQTWIARASGSTAQAHLYIRDIRRMPVPFAPSQVQDRVAIDIEERMSDIGDLEHAAQTTASGAARLRQSILKTAFEGKLVPQDPNDEPASVLLERIRMAHNAVARRVPRKLPREVSV